MNRLWHGLRESALSFLLSVQFFSRLPIPFDVYSASRQQRILNYLPLVGGVFGALNLLLWGTVAFGFNWVFPEGSFGQELAFAILLFNIWLSGALHLDGLADSADAALGSIGQAHKAQQIMHDSRIGTGGAVALVLVLLGKWLALSALLAWFAQYPAANLYWLGLVSLLAIPFFARLMPLWLVKTCPSATQSPHHRQLFAGLSSLVTLIYSLLAAALFAGLAYFGGWLAALAMVLLLWLSVWGLRRFALRLLGGVNGDLLGMSIELSELVLLFAVLFMLRGLA